jgi:hypothetical protein
MTPLAKENMIVVKDGSSGVIDSFEALAPSQAHRVLGCYKALTGQQQTAYDVIAKNALAKADLIRNSHLLPKHAHRHMVSDATFGHLQLPRQLHQQTETGQPHKKGYTAVC